MNLPLGRTVSYPENLDRGVLCAVDREIRNPFGFDYWFCHELSYLDKDKKPQFRCLSFSVPADSPQIVESKSLKLYLGSLFQTAFSSPEALKTEITEALSEITNSEINNLELEIPSYLSSNTSNKLEQEVDYINIDHMIDPAKPEQLQTLSKESSEILVFNSFRALCPVTSQPDYASIILSYKGIEIDHSSLANFLYSKSKSTGFHESWAENIYQSLEQLTGLDSFSLALLFSRRGGISINPLRTKPGYSGPDLAKIINKFSRFK